MLNAAEITAMTNIVASSLDVTVTVQRITSPTQDGSGHLTGTYVTVGTAKVNIIKPSATQLQIYAGIIGSQWALMIRFMPTTDIREGDQLVYMSRNWKVQNIQNAESYTFSNDALITTIV